MRKSSYIITVCYLHMHSITRAKKFQISFFRFILQVLLHTKQVCVISNSNIYQNTRATSIRTRGQGYAVVIAFGIKSYNPQMSFQVLAVYSFQKGHHVKKEMNEMYFYEFRDRDFCKLFSCTRLLRSQLCLPHIVRLISSQTLFCFAVLHLCNQTSDLGQFPHSSSFHRRHKKE